MTGAAPLARLLRKKGVRIALFVVGACLLYAIPSVVPDRMTQYMTPVPKSSLTYADNGLAQGWVPGGKVHPIEELMAKGKERWQSLISR